MGIRNANAECNDWKFFKHKYGYLKFNSDAVLIITTEKKTK